MTTWDRALVEELLYAQWRPWREEGRMDGVLPGCGDQEWARENALVGYRTLDYRTCRALTVPTSDGPVTVTMAEIYWSVRTRNGVQDTGWPPSLNFNLVALHDQAVGLAEVETLYRAALAMKGALNLAGMSRLTGRGGVSLYVRGVLLAPAVTDAAVLADAISGFADVPIAVATVEATGDDVAIRRCAGTARFFDIASADVDALRALGQSLVGNDALFRSDGVWSPDA